ncbi:TetR/AcrR family transcriptional regulator [Amycolatopsis sp. CA-126428]|uniref:TetR/AcrR family transcriptional regulator n=1 Tax=Amycolatopsis sp. CA-126428 TaxID=2073158 RepID=UPI000CD23B7B|nr:TetR/AcrR family transcriptional regulator [Amycolatopsis sp. CA-126428]
MPAEPDDEHSVGSWLPGLQDELLHPPRQHRSRRSMAQILTAAETVWTRDGPGGFTMAAISEESGISIGGLYSRFNGKHGLVLAVKDRLLTRLEQDAAERLHDHGKGLDHTVRELVTFLAQADLSAVARSLGTAVSPDEELFARGALAWQRLCASFCTAALRDAHEIGHRDPELALAMTFQVAMSCMASAGHTGGWIGLPKSRTPISDEVVDMCLNYLRA